MTKLMTDIDTRIALTSGHVFIFEANVPQDVPETLVAACRREGAFPANGTPPVKDEEVAPDLIIGALQDVMTEILQTGDPNLLTIDREPRHAEVKRRMTGDFTKAQFTTAWDDLETNG
jgi:hypothetical protein